MPAESPRRSILAQYSRGEQKELRDAFTKALNSLPEECRIILILRDLQQRSIAETSQVLGISEANVKSAVSCAPADAMH